MLEHLPGRRIVVLDDGSTYGTGLARAFAARLRGGGIAPVERLRLVQGKPAYPGIVDRLRRARAELLYFGGFHPEAAAVLRDARAAGLKLRLVGGDALATDEFWDQAGRAAQGTLFAASPDPRANPAARQVVAAFRDRGIEPEGYVLPAYAAVQV